MTICVDAGMVIRRVAFPDDLIVQQLWETWATERDHLVAPGLLRYEVTNVLYRYQRQAWLTADSTGAALKAALALPVDLIHDPDIHLSARNLSAEYQLPAAYDAHYLAVARWFKCPLWTTDRRLYQAMKSFDIDWINLVDHP